MQKKSCEYNDIHKMFVSHPARMNEFRFTYLHVPRGFKNVYFFNTKALDIRIHIYTYTYGVYYIIANSTYPGIFLLCV